VPLSGAEEIGRAVEAAATAFREWRRTPPGERIQYLFRFKRLLEDELDRLARTVTEECGKTYAESVGELRRGIENVEVACGIPVMMQGYNSEDIATGIDETMIRQPLGVVGVITPFNFPGMIPLWFVPYALACGNPVVLKPSEKVPMTATRLVELLERTGLPRGAVNLVHGAKTAVDGMLDHPTVRAVSFVGSSPTARYVYARGTANGKRMQCQGGAKNMVVVLPDADLETTAGVVAESAFGCAGQRCLATATAVTVGEARSVFTDAVAELASSRVVGYGLLDGVQMGPVISAQSKARIEDLVGAGVRAGGKARVDGRRARVPGYERGNFIGPTVLEGVDPGGELARTEVFGPVLSLMHAETVE
ncbi:MAG: aldehyde dehydrogenase family protein, partial [Candidatus Rokuibacteriota bacterium]